MAENMLSLAIERAKTNDVESTEGFVGETRSTAMVSLSPGDIIRLPKDYKVFNNANLSSEDKKVQYTFAEMLNENKEVIGVFQMYPSVLNRRLLEYKIDDVTKLPVSTKKQFVSSGKPCTDFAGFKTVKEAMDFIAGKAIRVVDVTPFQTRDFNDKSKLSATNVVTVEYVD